MARGHTLLSPVLVFVDCFGSHRNEKPRVVAGLHGLADSTTASDGYLPYCVARFKASICMTHPPAAFCEEVAL
jgi:hypothetical protein